MNNLYRIEEIKQEIRYYENLINNSREEIARLKKEIEELDNTYKKYLQVRNQYDEFQFNHEQQSRMLESRFKNIKFSKKLSTNITAGLRGNGATKSTDGIEKIVNDIQQYICRDDDEIKDKQNRIRRYYNQIDELEYELRNLIYQS